MAKDTCNNQLVALNLSQYDNRKIGTLRSDLLPPGHEPMWQN